MSAWAGAMGAKADIEAKQVDAPTEYPRFEALVEDHTPWLRQATRVRDEALRLLRQRFTSDIALAAELVGGRNEDAFSIQVQYANQLTADFLAESEKLFSLMNELVQTGRLHKPKSVEHGNGYEDHERRRRSAGLLHDELAKT